MGRCRVHATSYMPFLRIENLRTWLSGAREFAMRTVFAMILVLATCIATETVVAAEFCVHSAAEIQTALTTAASNGADDVIRIAGGNYALSTMLSFSSNEAKSIAIQGGFNPACDSFSHAETTLDGQHLVRPLYVGNANGNIQIAFLTFAGGFAASGTSGGGLIAGSSVGNIDLVLNRFIGNRATAQAGGLYAFSNSGSVRLRNNLLVANRGDEAGGAVLQQSSGDAFVVSNTIIANTSDNVDDPGGLVVTGSAHFTLSNNIIWNNAAAGGSDFGSASAHSRISNDIGIVAAGVAADTVLAELSIGPGFEPCGGFLCLDFELARSSPLVDVGTDTPGGGLTGSDLDFKARQIGPHVDIGAYENDRLFAHGFDP